MQSANARRPRSLENSGSSGRCAVIAPPRRVADKGTNETEREARRGPERERGGDARRAQRPKTGAGEAAEKWPGE